MSIFLRRSSAISPRRLLVTSCLRRSRSSASISSTMNSISSSETGRLAHAFVNPACSFALSKGSRVPSRFSTISLKGSRRSYVVNRFSHARHSRRPNGVLPLRKPAVDHLRVLVVTVWALHLVTPIAQHHIWYCKKLAHHIFYSQYQLHN